MRSCDLTVAHFYITEEKIMKKTMSFIICISIIVSVIVPIKTVHAKVYGDIQYEKYDDHIEITNCKKGVTAIEIPAEIEGLPVTKIVGSNFQTDGAFENCSNLTDIILPDSIIEIGPQAFSNCRFLKNIRLSLNLSKIGNSAFSYCDSLTNLTIPDKVISIGDTAFNRCYKLDNINIPNSIISIGENAFFNTLFYNKEINWKNGELYLNNWLLGVKSVPTDYSISPGTIGIADGVFRGKWFTDINLPDSLTYIGKEAFSDCGALTNISIGNKVTYIDYMTFRNCSSLEEVILPNSITSIGYCAFGGCSALKSINIPSGVISIEDYAFEDCRSLDNIVLPDSLTDYGSYPFRNCSGLKNLTIGGGIKMIDKREFLDFKSLVNVTINKGVESIEESAFENCSNLTNIYLPNTINMIDYKAFYECPSLTNVYYSGTKEQWYNIYFSYSNDNLLNAVIHFGNESDSGNENNPPEVIYPYEISNVTLEDEYGNELLAAPIKSPFIVNVELTKVKQRSNKDYLFVAVYDFNGALLSLDYVKSSFIYNSPFEIGFFVPVPLQDKTIGSIKVFVWNSFSTGIPLAEVKQIKI